MDFDALTDEQKAKAKACKTPEELLELAKQEGVELNDEQLDAISGGASWLPFLNGGGCPQNVMATLRSLGD